MSPITSPKVDFAYSFTPPPFLSCTPNSFCLFGPFFRPQDQKMKKTLLAIAFGLASSTAFADTGTITFAGSIKPGGTCPIDLVIPGTGTSIPRLEMGSLRAEDFPATGSKSKLVRFAFPAQQRLVKITGSLASGNGEVSRSSLLVVSTEQLAVSPRVVIWAKGDDPVRLTASEGGRLEWALEGDAFGSIQRDPEGDQNTPHALFTPAPPTDNSPIRLQRIRVRNWGEEEGYATVIILDKIAPWEVQPFHVSTLPADGKVSFSMPELPEEPAATTLETAWDDHPVVQSTRWVLYGEGELDEESGQYTAPEQSTGQASVVAGIYGGQAGIAVIEHHSGSPREMALGYTEASDYRSLSLNASGAVLLHDEGVAFGSHLGETMALVHVPGVPGVGVQNTPAARTNAEGYALIPYLRPYRLNNLVLQTDDLSPEVVIGNASQQVVPRRGAVMKASFNAEHVSRLVLTLLQANGAPVPFGAQVVDADGVTLGVVGQAGQALVSARRAGHQQIQVIWGGAGDDVCQLSIDPQALEQDGGYRLKTLNCPLPQAGASAALPDEKPQETLL